MLQAPKKAPLLIHLPHLPQCVRFRSFLKDSLIASYPYIEGIAFWTLNFMWFGCLLWPGASILAPLGYETLRSSLLGIPLLYLGSVLASGYLLFCLHCVLVQFKNFFSFFILPSICSCYNRKFNQGSYSAIMPQMDMYKIFFCFWVEIWFLWPFRFLRYFHSL